MQNPFSSGGDFSPPKDNNPAADVFSSGEVGGGIPGDTDLDLQRINPSPSPRNTPPYHQHPLLGPYWT